MFRKRSVPIVLTVFALVAFVTASSVQATPQAATATPGVVTKTMSPAEQRVALTKAAGPAQALQLPIDRGSAAPLSVPEAAPGAPGRSAAGAAAPGAEAVAKRAYPEAWSSSTAAEAATEAGAEGTSQVFSSYIYNGLTALQSIYPHRWVGRVTFTTPTGTSFCSGAAISGNVLLTAAHCVYNSTGNAWFSNWAFQPAYRNGSAPFGTFAAQVCAVLTAWINLTGSFAINTWSRHDVAVCKMGKNSAGQTLNQAVGFMGRQWNQPTARHFHTMGYPFRNTSDALLPSAGALGRLCAAESFSQTTETRGMGCNFSRGISGGPWVNGYMLNTVAGAADGVNSGFFIGTQNIYAARFNSNNIVPLCANAQILC